MCKILILALVTCAAALPNPDAENNDRNRVLKKECASGILSPACLKIGVINLIEKFNNKDEVTIVPGVVLVKDGETSKYDAASADIARSISEPEERLDKSLLYNLGGFLDTHSVKLKLLDDSAVEEAKNAIEEGRARMKLGGKKGGMGGLIAMAMMMKGTMMTMGLGALALLAGKALMTAMMSLLLSAIVGLKSLTGGQKSTTYEIVSKPVYSHSHSHSTAHEDVGGYGGGHSGYGRNLNVRRR